MTKTRIYIKYKNLDLEKVDKFELYVEQITSVNFKEIHNNTDHCEEKRRLR